MKKLKTIAEIVPGFQPKSGTDVNVRLVKLTNVNQGELDVSGLTEMLSKKFPENYKLRQGDVIFKAKCADNTAAYISEDLENVVAASHFLIIRVKDVEVLDPQYLMIFLNSEVAQHFFKVHSSNSTLPMIKKKDLEELEIPLPSIEKQRDIVKAYRLMKEEKQVLEQMIMNREKQFKAYVQENLK